MSTVDALIAKALSTTSDEEAMATFRMARKKNGGATHTSTTSTTVDSKWKAEAQIMKLEKEKAYAAAYNMTKRVQQLAADNAVLRSKIKKLEHKIRSNVWRVLFFIQFAAFCFLIMLGIL